jgi:hypothetical protein
MKTLVRTSAVGLLASLSFVIFVVSPSTASQPQALLLAPEPEHCLPKFGFSSFNIAGVGERVMYVEWGGLASRLGLEPGDVILSMNGYRLTYHGSWSDALHRAIVNGGHVRLRIRDVRTGFIAVRQMHVGGGIGPVTPKFHVAGGFEPIAPHVGHQQHGYEYPLGPVTAKSRFVPNHGHHVNKKLQQIAKLFED